MLHELIWINKTSRHWRKRVVLMREEHQVRRPSLLEVREARDRITDVSGCVGIPGMSVSAVRINMNDAPERLLMSPVSQRTKVQSWFDEFRLQWMCLWCVFRAADGTGLIRPPAGSQRCLWHSHRLLRHDWIIIRHVSGTTNLKYTLKRFLEPHWHLTGQNYDQAEWWPSHSLQEPI